jgi:hypothetical protein
MNETNLSSSLEENGIVMTPNLYAVVHHVRRQVSAHIG